MRFLAVHPSCLMYSKIFLRLEPVGLELVAAAARKAGHSVRMIDLQVESHADYFRLLKELGYDGFVGVEVSAMLHQKSGYDPAATLRLCYERLAPIFKEAGLQRPGLHRIG